jgi:hypothetical protein
MSIIKEPFRSYTLDEDKNSKDVVFSVRFNEQELQWLEEIKQDLNIPNNSRALKVAAFAGKNVLHGVFGRQLLAYLFSKDRVKKNE